MKTLLSISVFALLVSCVPKAIIVEPITPEVTRSKADVEAAGAASKRVHSGISETSKRIKSVRSGIDKALAQADAKRKEKQPGSIDEKEWEEQWKLLTDIHIRNRFAEKSADSTLNQSKEAQILQSKAEKGMGKLETSAKTVDKGVVNLKVENVKLGKDAALGKAVKWIVRIFVFLIIVFLFLAYILPLIRRLITGR